MLKINGQPITARVFAWDGCHKIYLLNTEEDGETYGYDGYGYDIYPIRELPQAWRDSCSLRFISNADFQNDPVSQFDPEPEITWED